MESTCYMYKGTRTCCSATTTIISSLFWYAPMGSKLTMLQSIYHIHRLVSISIITLAWQCPTTIVYICVRWVYYFCWLKKLRYVLLSSDGVNGATLYYCNIIDLYIYGFDHCRSSSLRTHKVTTWPTQHKNNHLWQLTLYSIKELIKLIVVLHVYCFIIYRSEEPEIKVVIHEVCYLYIRIFWWSRCLLSQFDKKK